MIPFAIRVGKEWPEWEYRTRGGGARLEPGELAELGKSGWLLVGFSVYTVGGALNFYYIFARPKKGEVGDEPE